MTKLLEIECKLFCQRVRGHCRNCNLNTPLKYAMVMIMLPEQQYYPWGSPSFLKEKTRSRRVLRCSNCGWRKMV